MSGSVWWQFVSGTYELVSIFVRILQKPEVCIKDAFSPFLFSLYINSWYQNRSVGF